MYAPIYNRQPVNELVDVAKILVDVADNGKGYLKLGTICTRKISVQVLTNQRNFMMISFKFLHRLNVHSNQQNEWIFSFMIETDDFSSKYRPYNLTLWKSSRSDGYSNYSKYFIEKYGEQIKPLFEYLFEDEFNSAGDMPLMALDYDNVTTWTEKPSTEETIISVTLKMHYRSISH